MFQNVHISAVDTLLLRLGTHPSDAATSVVLPHCAVASPHWVCMEAAVVSPQLLQEWLGRCKSSPMLTQCSDVTAQQGSTMQRFSVSAPSYHSFLRHMRGCWSLGPSTTKKDFHIPLGKGSQVGVRVGQTQVTCSSGHHGFVRDARVSSVARRTCLVFFTRFVRYLLFP